MKNAELKEAVAKYIESKELVLMGYSPEYIDDVKNDMEVAFRAGAEWMAGQGFPNWRDIEKTKPRQGEPCACVTVTYNGRIKYNNFENGPWYWSDKADFLSEKGAFVGTNDWGDKETHLCSYWMPWDELFAVLEKQLKEKQ